MSSNSNSQKTFPIKFQHLVLYTKDLIQSHRWYRKLFNLQFSAQNDPSGSAAMRLIKQQMHFFSFGHYHHDLALITRKGIQPDNKSMLNYSMRLRDHTSMTTFIKRLKDQHIHYKEGRLLKSAKTPAGLRAVCFKDPNGYWIEVFGKD
jgi:catechol-2,3-dioxygenase